MQHASNVSENGPEKLEFDRPESVDDDKENVLTVWYGVGGLIKCTENATCVECFPEKLEFDRPDNGAIDGAAMVRTTHACRQRSIDRSAL